MIKNPESANKILELLKEITKDWKERMDFEEADYLMDKDLTKIFQVINDD